MWPCVLPLCVIDLMPECADKWPCGPFIKARVSLPCTESDVHHSPPRACGHSWVHYRTVPAVCGASLSLFSPCLSPYLSVAVVLLLALPVCVHACMSALPYGVCQSSVHTVRR